MTTAAKQVAYLEDLVANSLTDCRSAPTAAAVTRSLDRPKRPRGRPPVGAVLGENGTYILPPAAVEAAAERVVKHRTACRERYVATRKRIL